MDNISKKQLRTSKNCQKQTNPTLLIIEELQKRKIYFSKRLDCLTGRPDIVFKRKKIAIFIDPDFGHRTWGKFIVPKTSAAHWKDEMRRQQEERALHICQCLSEEGWKVIRFWESEVIKDKNKVLKSILCSIGKEELL